MKNTTETYYIYLRIINHFNISFLSKSDFSILVELINRSAINHPISIGELADACHVSQATISRFVRRLGFSDYQDFNFNFYRAVEIAQLMRNSEHQSRTMIDSIEEARSSAIANINNTFDSLNFAKIESVIEMIVQSKNTIFLGTPENISHFARFQKDLIANSVPAFIFYDSATQLEFLDLVDEHTCAILFVLNNSYLDVHKKKINQLKSRNAKLILFTQEPYEDVDSEFSMVYQFGMEDSYRYGEYSLEYLSDILSSFLYGMKKEKSRL